MHKFSKEDNLAVAASLLETHVQQWYWKKNATEFIKQNIIIANSNLPKGHNLRSSKLTCQGKTHDYTHKLNTNLMGQCGLSDNGKFKLSVTCSKLGPS